MKASSLILAFLFISTFATAQKWQLQLKGGSNYTFLQTLQHKEESTPCPPNSGFCTVYPNGYELTHTFDSKWGGFGQLELSYKLNEKWTLQYALGSQLQRYQRHIDIEYAGGAGILFPGVEGDGDAQEGYPRWGEPFEFTSTIAEDPETGNTRLWYLRHQAGASYQLYPKLRLNIEGWADVLLHSAEYQMKYGYNSQKNVSEFYGEYEKSGADFKHPIAGLQTGISYLFLPRLGAELSFSRNLTPIYKKTVFVSPGKAYANQLQLGLSYSLWAL